MVKEEKRPRKDGPPEEEADARPTDETLPVEGDEAQLTDETLPAGEQQAAPTDDTLFMGTGPRPGTELPDGVPRTFGRYRILGVIGRGGMGVVYRAHDPNLDRDVALKVLIAGEGASPEQIERFFREAASAAKLHHPNIVPIHELDIFEGKHYFTMDCIEGSGLDDIIERGGLEPRRALELAEKVARAVHYAHEQGIIHRDLKPSNIIIDESGEPHVTDFGLAKELGEEAGLTRTGAALGTPAYMSPEQAEGRKDIDARADVYSLGAVLYEMLTKRPPFVSDSIFTLLRMAVDEEPVAPSKMGVRVSPDAETICMKCLEKTPERRYRTAGELADDIRRFLNAEPILAHPPSVFYRLRKKVFRHKWAVAVSAAVMIAVAAGVLGWLAVRAERRRAEAQWELVFEDDFEREGLGEGWNIKSGRWGLEGGALLCKGGDATILAPARAVGGVRIEYTAWVPEGHAPREFSCYLRASDDNPSAGYFFGFGAHDNSCAKVERAAHSGDVLRRGGRFVEPGERYRIRVEVADARLRVQVNGRPFLAWRDLFPLRGGGKVGFYSWEGGAHFDDVRVRIRRSAELVTALAGPDALYGAGEYEKAAAEYARLAEELRGIPAKEARLKEALSWLAVVAGERKEPRLEQDEVRIEHALAEAEPALSSLRRGELAAHAAMGLAQVMFERGRIEEAARIVCQAVELDPEADAAWELRAWPLRAGHDARSKGSFKAAAVLFECAARLPGQDGFSAAAALRDAGRALRSAGRLKEALMRFRKVEVEHAGQRFLCAGARLERGWTLRAMGRLDEALEIFESVERDYPDQRHGCASARFERGVTLSWMGRPGEALEVLESIEKDYKDQRGSCAQARWERGKALSAMGRPGEALACFSSVERDYPGQHRHCAGARVDRGLTLRAMGRLDEALACFSSVERDYPGQRGHCAGARQDRGQTLRAMGRPGEALEVLRSVEKDYKDQRGSCARALLLADSLPETRTGLRPDHVPSRDEFLRRAAVYRYRFQWSTPARFLLGDIGQEEFERLMFYWGWRPDVEYWKGEKACREGRKEDAVKHFSRAIELNIPGETWPLFEARMRLRELGAPVPPLPWEKKE